MSNKKSVVSLTDTFLIGLGALISFIIGIGLVHIAILGEKPYEIFTSQPQVILGILGLILLAGIFAPLIPRSYPRTLLSRCISIPCATASLVLPYAIPVVEYYYTKVALLIPAFIMLFPLALPYIISLIFAFGEVFYIQLKPQILENWKWNIRERTTYILIPYYFALICNVLIILRLLY